MMQRRWRDSEDQLTRVSEYAKKLSEDIADLLLNERVMITLEDETTQEFVRKVLDNNHFLVNKRYPLTMLFAI